MAKIYQLEFKLPEEATEKVVVLEKLSVGSGQDMDVTIVDAGLAKKQFIFRYQNKILTVQISGDIDCFLEGKKLTKGKVFILEVDDLLSCGELEIKVLLFAGIQEDRTFDGTSAGSRRISLSQSILTREIPKSSLNDGEEEEDESLLASDFNIIAPQITKQPETDNTAPTLENPIPNVQRQKKSSAHKTLTNLVTNLRSFLTLESQQKKSQTVAPIESLDQVATANSNQLTAQVQTGGKLPLHLPLKKPALIKIPHKGRLLSAWARLYAMGLMAALTYSGYHFLVPALGFERNLTALGKLIQHYLPHNFLQAIPFPLPFQEDHLWKLLPYLLTYAVIETLAHVLFARSLAHLLFGAQVKGNFLLIRILGPIRCWLGMITGPLLIFDFPLILGKPGLKEILTFTRIERGNSSLKAALGKFLLGPTIIIIVLALPLFSFQVQNLTLEDFQVPFENNTGRKIASSKDGRKLLQRNEMLQMQIPLSGEMSTNTLPFISFPTNIGTPRGGIKFWAGKDFLFLRLIGQISIKNIALKMKAGNPFLGDFYPLLDHYLTSGKLTPTAPDELQSLLLGIFSLQWSNLHHFFLQNGPFIFGPVTVKNEILSQLSLTKYQKSALEIIGNRNFLVLYPPKENDQKFLIGQQGDQLQLYQLATNVPNFTFTPPLQEVLDQIKWDTTLDLASTEKLAETTLLELQRTTPWSAFEIQNAIYLLSKWPNLKKTFVIEKTYSFYLQQFAMIEKVPQRKKDLRTSLINVISALSRLNFSANNIEKLSKLMESSG